MKTKLLLSALSLIGLNSIAQVVPNVDWVRYYSERSQISNVPSAIDANSNVYITGYTYPTAASADITTIKYDATGTVVWVKHYDNGGFDDANAITLDASSNVYVAGESDGTGTGRDLVVVKYDVNGNQLWVKRFNGVGNGNDIANALVVNSSGEVFVTGKTTIAGGTTNYVTIKLNSAGVQQWVHTFNGTGNSNDESVAIDFSSTGRLFITGTSRNATGNDDITTIRINPNNGNQMWAKTISGTATGNDRAYSLLSDGNDVVTVGSLKNIATNDDYVTLKHNGNNGNTIWQKNYDNGNSINAATSICKDASNNYVVTGTALVGTLHEYHTIMYNNSGVQQWVSENETNIQYPSVTPKIAVDPIANHFYVCGEKKINNNDIVVYQITPSGNKSWEQTFNGAMNNQDAAVDLVVNSQGVIYVAGASLNSNAKFDYTTVRISQTPLYFPPNITPDSAEIGYQYLENKGQILDINSQPIPNIKYYTLSQNPKVFIEKNKNYFLYSHTDTLASTNDTLVRLDVEFMESNPYTSVFSNQPTDGYFNFFLSHLTKGVSDLKGNKRLMIPNLWNNIDLHYYSNKNGLKYYFVLKNGINDLKTINLNFTGQKGDHIVGNDLVIDNYIKTLTLNRPKVYQVGLGGSVISTGTGVWKHIVNSRYGLDSLTNIISGLPIFIEIDMNDQPPLTTASTTGINWSTMYQNGTIEDIRVSNVTGKQYVTGTTSDPNFPTTNGLFMSLLPLNYSDAFVSQFNANNQIMWSTRYGGSGNSNYYKSADFGMSVDFDSLGYVYVGGYTYSDSIPTWKSSDPLAFFQSKMKYPQATQNYSDAFLLKLNSNGQSDISTNHAQWCTMIGGKLDETINDIRYFNGTVYCVGDGGKTDLITPAFSTPYQVESGAFNQDTAIGSASIYKFNEACQYLWGTGFNDSPTGQVGGAILRINACDVYNTSISGKDASSFASSNFGLVITGFTDGSWVFPNTTVGANLPSGGGGGDDAYITIFDSNDNIAYASFIASSDVDRGLDVVCSGAKSYVVGRTYNTAGNVIKFPFKYSSGEFIDTLYTGSSEGFISEFDNTTGLLKYSTLYGGNSSDDIDAVGKDINGNVYIHGTSSSSNIFIPSSIPTGMYTQTANGFDETFVGSMNATSRTFNWMSYFGGNGYDDESKAIDVYKSTDVYVVGKGSFSSGTFPTYAGTTGGYYSTTGNMYVSRLGISSLFIGIKELESNKLTGDILVYPNPATDVINFQLKDSKDNYIIEIYSSLGQVVYTGKVDQNNNSINVSQFSNGMYIINISDKAKRYTGKFIKQ
ncbi:MAG: T9SS type A sorting domain-containing protein [Bacteroidia bacterium]|nr:T9SS type A sorting domain-containing protein [Bacteroidia bacterium]